jgi:hypothetical protein
MAAGFAAEDLPGGATSLTPFVSDKSKLLYTLGDAATSCDHTGVGSPLAVNARCAVMCMLWDVGAET